MATTPQPSPAMIHTSQHHTTTTERSTAKRWGRGVGWGGVGMLGRGGEGCVGGSANVCMYVRTYTDTQCEGFFISLRERGLVGDSLCVCVFDVLLLHC